VATPREAAAVAKTLTETLTTAALELDAVNRWLLRDAARLEDERHPGQTPEYLGMVVADLYGASEALRDLVARLSAYKAADQSSTGALSFERLRLRTSK
jgi:hypothetical protein